MENPDRTNEWPWWGFRRQSPKIFWYFNALKIYIYALRNYASSKPSCFFSYTDSWLSIISPSCLRSCLTGITEKCLPSNQYCMEVHANKAWKLSLQQLHLLVEQGQFCLIYVFQFQNKAKRLSRLKKYTLVQFLYQLLTQADYFLEVTKISYLLDTYVLRLQIFIFQIFKYVMYVMLCM